MEAADRKMNNVFGDLNSVRNKEIFLLQERIKREQERKKEEEDYQKVKAERMG